VTGILKLAGRMGSLVEVPALLSYVGGTNEAPRSKLRGVGANSPNRLSFAPTFAKVRWAAKLQRGGKTTEGSPAFIPSKLRCIRG